MTVAYVAATRNGRLNVVRDDLDGGPAAAFLRFYDGTRPATGGAATTLLAECTFSDPCAPNATGGVLTMNAITDESSAPVGGVTTWARGVDSTGGAVFDCDVGTSGSDINLNTTTIGLGASVSISSMTITEGNA